MVYRWPAVDGPLLFPSWDARNQKKKQFQKGNILTGAWQQEIGKIDSLLFKIQFITFDYFSYHYNIFVKHIDLSRVF